MLDSMQEIKSNPFVNRLADIARSYGVNGVYVNWTPEGLNNGGIYFVCGLDNSKICNRNLDMLKIIENDNKSIGEIRTDIRAFRLDGQQPLIAHRNVVNYCQQLDTLQNVYRYVGKPIPVKMSPGTVELMRMTWKNFANETKSPAARRDYEKMIRASVEVVDKNYDTSSPEYKKRAYLSAGYYDTDRGKLYNWFKKSFVKHKNEVSLTHLVNHAGSINKATITHSSYQKVKDALNNRPDILYHFSDVRGEVLKVKDDEGFGSKEKNDRRYYTLHYPSVYFKDIENILHQIDYPNEYSKSITDIDPEGVGTEHVVVPDEYFEVFRKICEKEGVNLCIDHSAHSTIMGGIPVAFSAKDSAKAFSILNAAVKVYEGNTLEKALTEGKQSTRYLGEIKEPSLNETLSRISNHTPNNDICI